ncbi:MULTISPECIES: hypothetical protein [Metallosphaera]|nr:MULTISPECIES: hypothetical protein [Metallosphaera]WPX07350.1 hypothetical protein SOJ17_001112 [Metallosphaera sedula DSM 5348]BBL47196.1 hypothetical protein MJ1HA_1297 [Metallosphaera sedula]
MKDPQGFQLDCEVAGIPSLEIEKAMESPSIVVKVLIQRPGVPY